MKTVLGSLFLILVVSQLSTVTAYNTAMALELGYMSAVAYNSEDSIDKWTCPECKKYHMEEPKAFRNASGNIQGFVAYEPNKNLIFVAFRGSQDIRNWIINLSTTMSTYDHCVGCKVHTGFLAAYREVETAMKKQLEYLFGKHPTAKVYVTGHSLGASIGVLAAIDIQKKYNKLEDFYGLGCPRVGDQKFAQFAGNYIKGFRLIQYADIVPHMPPADFGFQHGLTEVWYQRGMGSFQLCTPESSKCANSLPVTSYTTEDHDLNKYLKMKASNTWYEKLYNTLNAKKIQLFGQKEELTEQQKQEELAGVMAQLSQLEQEAFQQE